MRGRAHGRRCACAKAGALRMREDGRLGNLSASAVTLVPSAPILIPSAPGLIAARVGPRRFVGGAAVLRGWSGLRRKGPGTRAPSLRGRREGAWGARGAGQHESAADGAETAQPAGGPGAGNGPPALPGPHQRGEPTGERGHGPREVACCGTRSLPRALCTVSLGALGLSPPLPVLEPPFTFQMFLLDLLCIGVGDRERVDSRGHV